LAVDDPPLSLLLLPQAARKIMDSKNIPEYFFMVQPLFNGSNQLSYLYHTVRILSKIKQPEKWRRYRAGLGQYLSFPFVFTPDRIKE